jgi:N-methylhydantoinase A
MLLLGIDVGGTFTDLVAFDPGRRRTVTMKVPTTSRAPEEGVLAAWDACRRETEAEPQRFVHASTLGTNTLLAEDRSAWPKVALLTTRGFRDVLELGRQRRPNLYDVFVERPRPLVPRRLRFEVDERLDAEGRVVRPLDPREMAEIAARLRDEAVDAVAVTFLHAFANPTHEEAAREALRPVLGDVPIVLSSEADPEPREYERTTTTVVHALLVPVMAAYVARLEAGLAQAGTSAPLFLMQSHGGMVRVDVGVRHPAALLESGPASGVMAAAHVGRALGLEHVLSFDMGGTTAKAGTIRHGTPDIAFEFEAGARGPSGRAVRGAGYPVRVPFVDLAEVSAGGGTVAWVDEGRRLRIGPQSAGAEPGPACYDRGGTHPTITDAHVVLGRLNPASLLGGAMPIVASLAADALRRDVAEPLGMDVAAAARAVVVLVEHHMAKLLRIVTVERGHDPRDFALMAFGGAGPLHACGLAGRLGIGEVVVPPAPGLFSAYGLLVTDLGTERAAAWIRPLADADPAELEARYAALEGQVRRDLGRDAGDATVATERWASLRYRHQGYELTVAVDGRRGAAALAAMGEAFHAAHERRYGYRSPDAPVEIVVLRVRGKVAVDKPPLEALPATARSTASGATRTVVVDDEGREADVPVLSRGEVAAAGSREGPFVIEEYDATTFVPPGWTARMAATGCLRIRREGDP